MPAAGQLHLDHAPLREQLGDPTRCVASATQIDLGARERSEQPHEVVHTIGVACVALRNKPLQLALELGEHVGIEEFAQFLGAEQLAEQIAIERERRGTAFGQWRVVLVHVHGDPPEQQRLRHRRRLATVDRHNSHTTRADIGEHPAQRRKVEDVVAALARCFEEDRELWVLRGNRQQVGGPLALLPQRRAPVGAAAR